MCDDFQNKFTLGDGVFGYPHHNLDVVSVFVKIILKNSFDQRGSL